MWPDAAVASDHRRHELPRPAHLGVRLGPARRSDSASKSAFDGSDEDEDFQEVLVNDYSDIVVGRTVGVQQAEGRMDELRSRIDRALDIYNECRRLMEEGGIDCQAELAAFQQMAQEELQACTCELRALEMQVAQARDT